MKRRLFVPMILAGMAAASGVASANSQYWRDNGLLLEVSADPRDGRDFVRVDATRATQLELVALNDVVTLRGITLTLADGRTVSRPMHAVRPGQPFIVDLPANLAPITAVALDYGDPALRRYDRSPARLQIVPRMTHPRDRFDDRYQRRLARHHAQPRYVQPSTYTVPSSSYYAAPPRAPRYTVVEPRSSGWTFQGSVHGSIRF